MASPARRALRLVAPLAAVSLALAACGGGGGGAAAPGGPAATAPARPRVTFTAADGTLSVPAEVPGGLVDVRLVTAPGRQNHHLLIARLDDGVTLEQVMAAPDDQFFSLVKVKGGNGSIPAGEDLDMTLDLEPGNYAVADLPAGEVKATAQFRVTPPPAAPAAEPQAKGTIAMGPGMVLHVPEDFDGTGVWKFENHDQAETHEAAMMRLKDAKTTSDLVAFGNEGFQGEPPVEGDFGSMGALGPGERAWVTLEPGAPGEYALVCFIPGAEGPHFMKGMVAQVTVGAGTGSASREEAHGAGGDHRS